MPTHDLVEAERNLDVLGWSIDGARGFVRPSARRAWRAIRSVEFVVSQHSILVRDVEKVVGHLSFSALLARESLSCFNAIYKWIHAHERDSVAPLWPSVRRELRGFQGLVPLLRRDLRATWSPTVLCTDASPTGFGVLRANADLEQISKCGRINDRCFFFT